MKFETFCVSVYHSLYRHCDGKSLILPFFSSLFSVLFPHESSVRFTVLGIYSHNKEDVKSASGKLMPETSHPMS